MIHIMRGTLAKWLSDLGTTQVRRRGRPTISWYKSYCKECTRYQLQHSTSTHSSKIELQHLTSILAFTIHQSNLPMCRGVYLTFTRCLCEYDRWQPCKIAVARAENPFEPPPHHPHRTCSFLLRFLPKKFVRWSTTSAQSASDALITMRTSATVYVGGAVKEEMPCDPAMWEKGRLCREELELGRWCTMRLG